MSTAILIVGLPGSGKTHLANTKYVPKGFLLLDDPRTKDELIEHLRTGVDLVITDPHLCKHNFRNIAKDLLESWSYQVEFVYFENNPEKCRKLIKHRNDGRLIERFESFQYTIPTDVTPLAIYELT
jgi:predicted kinase